MCGIAGIFKLGDISELETNLVARMNVTQKHRGPDDEGLFFDRTCALGHRRLAIIDLSKDGHQPFASDDGRFQLVFNGEIYNYIELREELEAHGWAFNTKTDTEVLLKAFLCYGKDCLNKFNGMFAFAIYDLKKKTLFMARDRVGIKPLYYAVLKDTLYFASEIKTLCLVPEIVLTLNYQSLFDYLVFNRTDVFDETFFCGIKRLPNGHYAEFDMNRLSIRRWWNPDDYVQDAIDERPDHIYERIREIMVSAVKLRMRSDVPLGSCLSGGLDSSIITGILFEHCGVKEAYPTFTAAFPGHKLDETDYIDILNKKYPFKNLRTFPTSQNAYSGLKEFVYANDEPTTNYAFFAQYQVMKLAREHGVTVLLDGQGGDENFAGYQYFHGFNLYGLLRKKKIFSLISELAENVLRKQDKSAYQTFAFQLFSDKFKKTALLQTLPYIDRDFFYAHVDKSLIFNEFFKVESVNQSLVKHFQYKLEHLLRMEDRNSMAFSIEARVPYLDHRLIEYVLGIPGELKIKGGETKYLQKKSIGRYSVPEILNRKDKIGFGTPGEEWMQNDAWIDITQAHYNHLTASFPDVFKKDVRLPVNGFDRWKINQFCVWKTLFMDSA